ncbi:myocyte-specific enhancer factor 2A [Chanos chanos]|uniref:Myocyte-specific enhancer factor 2A n=1 Tax=Chanos chanos TaxID=29144 RepID=A0A6J2UL06_CHACN|nr:myocyte-specific enhancer factor 2A-like [Chanos chanos]
MGRKKIQITRIIDERNRQVTFTKRKFGLMKKAYELSVLCDCEIALIIFNSSNKLFQYASTDMDKVLLKYTEYNEPHESRTNSDIVEALNKKELRGCDSPDPDMSYVLTPHTEEKYQKINEEFDIMMRNHKAPAVQQSFSMPVTVPVSNPSALSYSPGDTVGTHTPAIATASLRDSDMSSPAHAVLHRGLLSPAAPQCSPSIRTTVNGFVGKPSGSSLGRVTPALSPSPPAVSLATTTHKSDLRIVIPPTNKHMTSALNTKRINSPQCSQSLATPVVSVTTPSLPSPDLVYSAITSTYTSDSALNSAEVNSLTDFSLPDSFSLGSGSSWQQSHLGQAALSSQGVVHHLPQGSSSTTNAPPELSIKSEPVSPPQDNMAPSGFLIQPPVPSATDSLSSSSSLHEESDPEDQRSGSQSFVGPGRCLAESEAREIPAVKRMRAE